MKWRSLEESASAAETRPLRDVYAERKELIAKYVPADILAIHARAVAELKESGLGDRALQVGSSISPFELSDHDGKLARSSELLERGPLVVCFFRGRWCPFCVGQMEAMNAVFAEIQELGGSLIGISPQTVQQSFFMVDQHKLRFPLLSDAGNKVARQFGLVYRVAEYQQEIYRRALVNLPFVNGDNEWELPIPATYILSRGKAADEASAPRNPPQVLYASVNPDYTERPEPDDIVRFLSHLSPSLKLKSK
jgi:peroxiredoxin